MRLNDFGKKARLLRMDLDLSLKEMADDMKISSAHLSGLEYGDKKLNDGHVNCAIEFFRARGVASDDLADLREAAAKSMDSVSTKELGADARAMVAAFARKLQEDGVPADGAIASYLKRK